MNITQQARAIDTLIADFCSGILPLPLQILCAAHLEMNSQNHQWLTNLDSLASSILLDVKPTELSNSNKILNHIFRSNIKNVKQGKATNDIPLILTDFIGSDIDNIQWKKKKFTQFQEVRLGNFDGHEANLYCLPAASSVPSHTHHGTEITLVLKGAFTDTTGHYKYGDIAIADNSIDHRPVADASEDCICFAVTDAPLRLTGRIGRLIAPFVKV